MQYRRTFFLLATAILPAYVGCGGSVSSQLRQYDAATAVAKAMELYDASGDSKISGDELKKCPALAASIGRIDTDADRAISREELQARFDALDAQSDLVAVSVTVTAKGRPLTEAEVTLTPCPFMGESLQNYSGTTDSVGRCQLSGSVKQLPGLPSGFYEGKVVQAGSNVDAVRGIEIADDASGNRVEIAL